MQARSSFILFSLFIILCSTYASGKVITGAERMDQYYNRQIKKFPTEKQNVSLKHILT